MEGPSAHNAVSVSSLDTGGGAIAALTGWVLAHKRIVLGAWLLVTIAAFAAIGPAGSALSQQFNIPGREGFETNKELAAIYGSGGDVAPIVPVVQLPAGTTVDSPGVRDELEEALAKVAVVLPGAMLLMPRRVIGRSYPTTAARPSRSSTSLRKAASTPARKRRAPRRPRSPVSPSAEHRSK